MSIRMKRSAGRACLLAVLVGIATNVSCDSGSGDNPAGPTTLTDAERASIATVADAVLRGFAQEAVAGVIPKYAAQPRFTLIEGWKFDDTLACPGGGQWSGAGNASMNYSTESYTAQGTTTSTLCVTSEALNVTGTLPVTFSGTCPGSVKATMSGDVSVYRKDSEGNWIPVQSPYPIQLTVNQPC